MPYSAHPHLCQQERQESPKSRPTTQTGQCGFVAFTDTSGRHPCKPGPTSEKRFPLWIMFLGVTRPWHVTTAVSGTQDLH